MGVAVGGTPFSLLIAAATSNLPPLKVFPEREVVATADCNSASFSCCAVACGAAAAIKAKAPVTWGVAIDVPLYVPY